MNYAVFIPGDKRIITSFACCRVSIAADTTDVSTMVVDCCPGNPCLALAPANSVRPSMLCRCYNYAVEQRYSKG